MTKLHSIKEQTYEIIKRKILTRQLPLGERINVVQLSKELGVSNSPIREALNLLEKHGLVVNVRNSGTQVVSPSVRDRYELAQMTLFMMIGAYQYCRETGRTDQLADDLTLALSRQKQHLDPHSGYECTYHAGVFDRCIIAATGNRMMIKQFDNMVPLARLCSLYDCQHGGRGCCDSLRFHEIILRAVKNHDDDLVISTLRECYYRPAFDLRKVRPARPDGGLDDGPPEVAAIKDG